MTDRIVVAGHVYVTARGAVADFTNPDQPHARTDVTVHMVRAWVRRNHLKRIRSAGRVYYQLAALKQAEQQTDERRATHGGRPRPKILDDGLTSVVHLGAAGEVCPQAGG